MAHVSIPTPPPPCSHYPPLIIDTAVRGLEGLNSLAFKVIKEFFLFLFLHNVIDEIFFRVLHKTRYRQLQNNIHVRSNKGNDLDFRTSSSMLN